MKLHPIPPSKSLNKAYRKTSLRRDQIESFKSGLVRLFSRINEREFEENQKNVVADFLKEVWYKMDYEINTKDRKDQVIHLGRSASDPVAVIIEAKRLGNKAEMISPGKPNTKAFHELILYYLRERIDQDNNQIKHLVATNIWEWYIFDGVWFEKNVFRNNKLKAGYEDFRTGGHDNRFFYEEIAGRYLESLDEEIPVTYFNLKDFEEIITNPLDEDDVKLLELYKILSPEHLLKKNFANDSNVLNKDFYHELLHIIGLGEFKEKSKKIIGRKPAETRDEASLLENAINILKSRGRISQLPGLDAVGTTEDDRLFSGGLELVITWLNRILFLKLLEGQLVSYHKGDESYRFLNSRVIEDFDQLNELFFDVLAKPESERTESVREKFGKLPYLNSSLFEESPLERTGITIAELKDRLELPIYASSVLKDAGGRKITGKKKTLAYLFDFLDAYDFSSDSASEIQEQNKSLISASVLGLIFEKINGYKDGSFFTPGFITMYMCRETIRRAVLHKFNEAKGWNCSEFDQIYDKIVDKKEANDLINSLKICDPAVGSGHFLVSALNELIAIKSELKILRDRQGKTLRDYQAEVINDELVVTDDDGRFFRYNPRNEESRRVQEALFHEKQTIIESCLFGVDINPKSVMICRLRLWIELLKNAYYRKQDRDGVPCPEQLETLPNLDINIKCGNSLISRFPLDADLGQALRGSKWNIGSYRLAVNTYRNAENKAQKLEMERLISDIKSDFESEVARNDKRLLKLNKLKGKLTEKNTQFSFFEMTRAQKNAWEKEIKKLTAEISAIEKALEEVRSNKIYENAFEWRFEFPEVLDDNGNFVGFDVVIGNPPYISVKEIGESLKSFFAENYSVAHGQFDLYLLFIEESYRLLSAGGYFSMITSNTYTSNKDCIELRKFLVTNVKLLEIINLDETIFQDAKLDVGILSFVKKFETNNIFKVAKSKSDFLNGYRETVNQNSVDDESNFEIKVNQTFADRQLLQNLKTKISLGDIALINRGIEIGSNFEGIEKTNGSDLLPIIVGSDISKYMVWSITGYLKFQCGKESVYKTFNLFSKPRILVQRIRNLSLKDRIIATYTEETLLCTNTLRIITLKGQEFPILSLLGIMNSSLINYFFLKNFNNKDIYAYQLAQIPIPPLNHNISESLERLVRTVLAEKRINLNFDSRPLEREIDKLVYDLYGLTEEERRIVEGG